MRYRSALSLAFCAAFLGSVAKSQDVLTVLVDGDPVKSSILSSMEREAEEALSPSGVRLSWKHGHDLDGTAVDGRLAVIHLHGQCHADRLWLDGSHAGVRSALGRTHMADRQVLPIADVLCDTVRELIGSSLRLAPSVDREALLGRALGRVAAHELYHILLRTTVHGDVGLAHFSLSSADLLAPRASFGEPDQHKISEFAFVKGGGH